ncbi:hypothetical protein [Priestia aryabhattai]
MLSVNNFKDVTGVKEGFDKEKLFSNLKVIEKYVSKRMENSQLAEGLKIFIEQYGSISVYERNHKMIIFGALKGIVGTIEKHLFDNSLFNQELTAEEKDVNSLINNLKDVMVHIDNELDLKTLLKEQRKVLQRAGLK